MRRPNSNGVNSDAIAANLLAPIVENLDDTSPRPFSSSMNDDGDLRLCNGARLRACKGHLFRLALGVSKERPLSKRFYSAANFLPS